MDRDTTRAIIPFSRSFSSFSLLLSLFRSNKLIELHPKIPCFDFSSQIDGILFKVFFRIYIYIYTFVSSICK